MKRRPSSASSARAFRTARPGTTPRSLQSASGSRTRSSPGARSRARRASWRTWRTASPPTAPGTRARTITSSRSRVRSRACAGRGPPAWIHSQIPSSPSAWPPHFARRSARRFPTSPSRRARIRATPFRSPSRCTSSSGSAALESPGSTQGKWATSARGSGRCTMCPLPPRRPSIRGSTKPASHRLRAAPAPIFPGTRCSKWFPRSRMAGRSGRRARSSLHRVSPCCAMGIAT